MRRLLGRVVGSRCRTRRDMKEIGAPRGASMGSKFGLQDKRQQLVEEMTRRPIGPSKCNLVALKINSSYAVV